MNPWPGEGKKIGNIDWMKAGSGHTWSVTGSTLTSPITDKPSKPSGDTLLFVDSGNSFYSTSGVKYAPLYNWNLFPVEAGTVTGTDTLATIDWSESFSGTAQLSVNGRNRSGEGNVSDILSITVLPSEADPTLQDISLDYQTIDSFASNIFDYYVEMTSASIPVIEAITKNPDAIATITLPTSIPGMAVIEVQSSDQLQVSIYTIHFEIINGETWSWAAGAGGRNYSKGNAISIDNQGNVVVSGTFNGSSISFGSSVLQNDGYTNIFVAKFDPSGNVIWAKNASGDGEDNSQGICTDSEGNVYVSGEFSSKRINFGTISIDNSGNTDVFIAKYSASGQPEWVRAAEGLGNDCSTGVTLDANNNPYITGSYESSPFHFGEKYLPNKGRRDIFISKFDPQGSVIWTKWAGGCSDDVASDITSDQTGNIYLTGMCTSPVISFGLTTLENDGCGLMFVAKLAGISLSIDQVFTESSLAIFPNPSFGEFTVQCSEDTYEIRIFDSRGSLVRLIRPEGKTMLRTFLTGNGLFYVQTRSVTGVSTQKLIVIQDK